MKKSLLLFVLTLFAISTSFTQVPANDLIENAIEITPDFTDENVRLDLANTSNALSGGCIPANAFSTVFYKYTATADGALEATLSDNSFVAATITQSLVIIHSAPDLNQTDVSQLVTVSECTFGESATAVVSSGQSYYIEVHRPDADALSNISFSFVPSPVNDTIENAIEITGSFFDDDDVRIDLAAYNPGGQVNCSLTNFPLVYYKFTANTSGQASVFLISGNGVALGQTAAIFYTANNLNATTNGELTLASSCSFGSQNTVFNIVEGQYYYILVYRDTLNDATDIRIRIPQDGTPAERQALIDLYNATDGPNWAFNDNWNTAAPLSEWVNVTVENGHVTNFSIGTFGATGTLPSSLTDLTFLKTAGFSSNNLFGEVPDFASIPTIEDVNISNNNFSFGDLETHFTSNSNIPIFRYANQSTVDAEIQFEPVIGLDYTLNLTPDTGTNVSYQWYKDRDGDEDVLIPGATNTSYELTNIQTDDLDSYTCKITSPTIPDFTITRRIINLTGPVSQQERDALIAFYNALDGDNWSDNTNWLSNEPVGDWAFIDTRGNKVVRINIFGDAGLNGQLPEEIGDLLHLENLSIGVESDLIGPLPETIGNLTQLQRLRIQGTGNSGNLPLSIENLSNLKELRIIGNNFSGDLPSGLSNLTNLEDFYVIGRGFVFNGTFNQFTGELPDLTGNPNLFRLQVSGNDFSGVLPDYSVLPNLTTLVIDENLYSFSDLATNQANNETIDFYIFSPQRNNSMPETVEIPPGTPITLDINGNTTTGRFFNLLNTDQYQWFKDDVAIAGAEQSTYTINNPQESDSGVYYCEITNTTVNGLVVTRADITLNVDAALSINDVEFQDFKLYPNPAKNWLNISGNRLQNANAKVYDLNGRLILEKTLESNTTLLNIENLSLGMYMIRLTDTNNATATKRFIKQ